MRGPGKRAGIEPEKDLVIVIAITFLLSVGKPRLHQFKFTIIVAKYIVMKTSQRVTVFLKRKIRQFCSYVLGLMVIKH